MLLLNMLDKLLERSIRMRLEMLVHGSLYAFAEGTRVVPLKGESLLNA